MKKVGVSGYYFPTKNAISCIFIAMINSNNIERHIYAADTAHTKHFIFHLFVLHSYVYICVGKLVWFTHVVAHMQTSEDYLAE